MARSSSAAPTPTSSPRPQHPYTKHLIASEPKGSPPAANAKAQDHPRGQGSAGVVPDQARLPAATPSAISRRSTASTSPSRKARPSASSASRARARRRSAWRCSGSISSEGPDRLSRQPHRRLRFEAHAAAHGATCRSCSRTLTARCRPGFRSGRSSRRASPSRTRRSPAKSAGERVARALKEVGLDPDVARPLSARVLRRPAPAHRHRPGARARAEIPHSR